VYTFLVWPKNQTRRRILSGLGWVHEAAEEALGASTASAPISNVLTVSQSAKKVSGASGVSRSESSAKALGGSMRFSDTDRPVAMRGQPRKYGDSDQAVP